MLGSRCRATDTAPAALQPRPSYGTRSVKTCRAKTPRELHNAARKRMRYLLIESYPALGHSATLYMYLRCIGIEIIGVQRPDAEDVTTCHIKRDASRYDFEPS